MREREREREREKERESFSSIPSDWMDSQIKFDLIKIIVKLKGHKNSIKVYIRSKVVSSHEIVGFEQ